MERSIERVYLIEDERVYRDQIAQLVREVLGLADDKISTDLVTASSDDDTTLLIIGSQSCEVDDTTAKSLLVARRSGVSDVVLFANFISRELRESLSRAGIPYIHKHEDSNSKLGLERLERFLRQLSAEQTIPTANTEPEFKELTYSCSTVVIARGPDNIEYPLQELLAPFPRRVQAWNFTVTAS